MKNQAQKSHQRLQEGAWEPDPAAVGYEFEDGSRLTKTPEGWSARYIVGQRVHCNGQDDCTVSKICDGILSNMIEVRVANGRGVVCVSASEVMRFDID